MISRLIRIASRLSSVGFGIGLATVGLKSFLLPNHFIDGGVTGISMLVSELGQFDLAVAVLVINIPFVLVAARQMSWRFAISSILGIVGLAICLHVLPLPVLTQDKMLSAIFGGITLGAGMGFAFRGGAVLDGTEILAILLNKRFDIRIGDLILTFNALLFTVAAVVLGLERALYSILTYVAASKSIDFLVYGFEHLGIHIISAKSQDIRRAIISELGLGVTILKGQRGNSGHDQDILYCVCTRFELGKVKSLSKDHDAQAFITIHKITDAHGGVLRHPTLFKNLMLRRRAK